MLHRLTYRCQNSYVSNVRLDTIPKAIYRDTIKKFYMDTEVLAHMIYQQYFTIMKKMALEQNNLPSAIEHDKVKLSNQGPRVSFLKKG